MNPLTPVLISILTAVARYYTLTRMQLEDLCMPGKSDGGRRMRKHLTALRHEGLINQTQARVVFVERNGAPAPVYYPSRKGCEVLAAELKDESFLATCTLTPTWQHLHHWTRIADFRILLDRACSGSEVKVEHWLTEWTVANPEEKAPEKRYSLFTLLQETPRLVCAPDASFVLSYRGYRKGVYVEIDRHTSGINQIANSKTPGYAKMAEVRGHVRHFPGVNPEIPFTVLHVSPSSGRRDLVAKAIKGKPGEKLWKFASWDELSTQTALHEPILRDVDGKALPLVRRLEGGVK
jgi:hypothetical protein